MLLLKARKGDRYPDTAGSPVLFPQPTDIRHSDKSKGISPFFQNLPHSLDTFGLQYQFDSRDKTAGSLSFSVFSELMSLPTLHLQTA